MGKKSILFDQDGTLTDSGEGIMKCAKLGLEHFGIEVPDINALRVFVGPPLRESFIKFGVPEDNAEEAIAVYRSRYIPIGKYENHPYPGIPELLEKLCAQGYDLYVATSKPEEMSVDILKKFGLDHYFSRICGASMDASRSNKEDVIAYLLQQCDPDGEVIMVGDTKYDVLGAKFHGIPCIGVAWGYGEVADLEESGAAAIVDSMDALYAALNQ